MNGDGTIDMKALGDQLGVIAWRMAETLPEYLPFLLAGVVLIVFGKILRKPRSVAVGSLRADDAFEEEETRSAPAVAGHVLRLAIASAMRLAGRLVIVGCIAVVTLRASGFEETTTFVDANYETLMRIAQKFRQ